MLIQDQTPAEPSVPPRYTAEAGMGSARMRAGSGRRPPKNVRQLANPGRPAGTVTGAAQGPLGKFANWQTRGVPSQNGTPQPLNTAKRESITLPDAWVRKYLTPAKQRVVETIGAGRPTKTVAPMLDGSPFTVRNQLNRAMEKLGVESSYELLGALRPLPARAIAGGDEGYFANAI